MTDVVQRAKEALEGVYEGPWVNVGGGNIHVDPVGARPPVAKTWTKKNGDFVAAARSLVPELLSELTTAEQKLAAIRELHYPGEWLDSTDCVECGEPWPCRTAAIVDGTPGEGEKQ